MRVLNPEWRPILRTSQRIISHEIHPQGFLKLISLGYDVLVSDFFLCSAKPQFFQE